MKHPLWTYFAIIAISVVVAVNPLTYALIESDEWWVKWIWRIYLAAIDVYLILLVVAVFWVFGVWPLGCRFAAWQCDAGASPFETVAGYWARWSEAWPAVREELTAAKTEHCPDQGDDCETNLEENWDPPSEVADQFSALSGLLGDVAPPGLLPRVFGEPSTLTLPRGQGAVLSWPAGDAPSAVRIGSVVLRGDAASRLCVRHQIGGAAAERPDCPNPTAGRLCPAAPSGFRPLPGPAMEPDTSRGTLRFAVLGGASAALTLCCYGAPCVVGLE